MAVGVEELYCNLNKLLDDICKFLGDEANYEKLSPNSRKQADELINRSKFQLQEIAKVAIDSNGYDGAYVDMERKSAEDNDDDKNNIYSSVDETTISNPPVIQQTQNPYSNLPAKELLQDIKYGSLSWRCKIILKFEKLRRIYAGVHNNWLLIYSSEKDCKPLQTFNLKFHRAQTVSSKQGKTLLQDFELICTLGEKKSYYFIALTHKDMLQWIAHINKCYDLLNKSHEPSLSEEEVSETYDMIGEVNSPENSADDEEETIYHDIEIFTSPHEITNVNKPPDLPARRSVKPNTPLPIVPISENEEEELSSTYDPVNLGASFENSSFSEDDEDNIYEPKQSSAYYTTKKQD
ncbi:uncharacterized protein BDFB_007152 [Asbolus verrucosus]|uniref:PH domain-containing protein n=1 Tax=Asbolus verrucosus TaxID=1661398 RepID=A0A482VFG8_ASBVE|nr:uncharacterized protein BDFB_007152 [Asbolus verrucosus]